MVKSTGRLTDTSLSKLLKFKRLNKETIQQKKDMISVFANRTLSMNITENKVVSVHYTLTDTLGKVLDKSEAEQPMVYLHGASNIIPGLEKALATKVTGDKVKVTVPPEEAYGVRDERKITVVHRSMFGDNIKVEKGVQFQADGNTGLVIVTVTKIEGDDITVDGNHPLAGKTLIFEVEIKAIREATAEELKTGHIHGSNCDHH